MPSRNIQVVFEKEKEPEDDREEEEIAESSLRLELDAVANEGKTSFTPGEIAYLRLSRLSDDLYSIRSSAGIIRVAATRVPFSVVDEHVVFADSDSESLSYIPSGAVLFEWIGENPGPPIFSGNRVLLADKAVAVLRCNYTALADRLAVTYEEEGLVVAVVTQGDLTASQTVTFAYEDEDEEEEPEPVPHDLEVLDFCTDEPIEGATITLDGAELGQTDAEGMISLGALVPGSQHDLKMVKTGYFDSDADNLNNDSFTAA